MADLNSDVKLYVITHVPCKFIESNILIPIATNKALGDQLNIISSEEGENKASENPVLAEFSTFYWAWKNDTTSKYIGFYHFRRYLIPKEQTTYDPSIPFAESSGLTREYIIDTFNNYDLVVPKPMHFNASVLSQYYMCHENFIIESFMEVIRRKYPHMLDSFNTALQINYGYYCNLFIMRREDFNDYMTFVFDIYEELKPVLAQSHQIKPFAYLGERIFCCYVQYLKTIKHFRVKEVPTYKS